MGGSSLLVDDESGNDDADEQASDDEVVGAAQSQYEDDDFEIASSPPLAAKKEEEEVVVVAAGEEEAAAVEEAAADEKLEPAAEPVSANEAEAAVSEIMNMIIGQLEAAASVSVAKAAGQGAAGLDVDATTTDSSSERVKAERAVDGGEGSGEGESVSAGAASGVAASSSGSMPIPQALLNECEAKAMWADAEVVEKQFPASSWPAREGVFWRLAHKISCEERSISCNTKAIPAGEVIVCSIFIHVTTPQVSAHTYHCLRATTCATPYAAHMARPEMCVSALVRRLSRHGGRRWVSSPQRSGSS